MAKKGEIIDRTGEINRNNFGSEMIITSYRRSDDVDVYFPEYNWFIKNKSYHDFKRGSLKCPYEPRVHNKGFTGEGEVCSIDENRKISKCYGTWENILKRCYSQSVHSKHETYIDCEIVDEWLNLQVFAQWFEDNYYEVEGQRMDLDKDILIKGNKLYSPETCVFVPHEINVLFVKNKKSRGKLPVGVTLEHKTQKFISRLNVGKERIYLGLYDTPQEAFEIYKHSKEQYIKNMADKYKEHIPKKLYETMYNYKVEITD